MIRLIFTLIILTALNIAVSGKGSNGAYYIKGTAYSGKKILAGATITVTIGTKTLTFTTDVKGKFNLEIPWSVPCPSLRTEAEIQAQNKRANPECLTVECAGSVISLPNKWKKYAGFEKRGWKRDLHF